MKAQIGEAPAMVTGSRTAVVYDKDSGEILDYAVKDKNLLILWASCFGHTGRNEDSQYDSGKRGVHAGFRDCDPPWNA